ncbi:MAG: hypothetical protein LC715_03445 [Gammaproteobacteria bacterium]|nr:hypothetical protein [Gammaproteobacteria bacterium]
MLVLAPDGNLIAFGQPIAPSNRTSGAMRRTALGCRGGEAQFADACCGASLAAGCWRIRSMNSPAMILPSH